MAVPGSVRSLGSVDDPDLARPKSPSFTRSVAKRMFDGFTSRWASPARWSAPSALETATRIGTSSSGAIGRSGPRRSASEPPGQSSMTTNGSRPAVASPGSTSKTATSPGQGPAAVVGAWRAAAAATDRPVKQVLAGPYSAGRDGAPSRPVELAESLRVTVVALAEAGCPFIEIDESAAEAIAVVAGERQRFVEAHHRLLDVVGGTHVSLALTGANLDGAGPTTFFDLPYASYAFDLIAGPDNWRLIAAAPQDRGIVCGALDPRPNGDETRELLIWAAHYAASTNGRGPNRVGLANAPSLAPLDWPV